MKHGSALFCIRECTICDWMVNGQWEDNILYKYQIATPEFQIYK